MSNAQKKPPLKKGVSPAGIASFPFLNRPDEYKGKKSYKTTLRIGGDESEALRDLINEETEKALADTKAKLEDLAKNGKDGKTKAKAKAALEELTTGLPYTESVDDDGEGTGDYEFKFKCNAEFEDKKTGDIKAITVPIFDAKKKQLNKTPKDKAPAIWAGSTLKVAFSLVPYYVESAKVCGVSLRINGVQIIELVSGSGGSADSMGFGDEDGYESEETGSASDFDTPSASGADDDEDF